MRWRLGQHFLINKNKIRKIVEILKLKSGDVIVEIGPGHGELTDQLINEKSKVKIIAIEKDEALASGLKKKFEDDKNVEIIEGDALKILPKLITDYQLQSANFKLVGNIPYYITGRLLRVLSELKNKPEIIILTIQKEVAERICSAPPQMNLLAAVTQFWADPTIIDYVSKNDFRPMPKVNSAIIKLTILSQQFSMQDADKYYKFVRILFKQPRKTIMNNLRPLNPGRQFLIEKLQLIGVNPKARPQNLTLKQIKDLSTLF